MNDREKLEGRLAELQAENRELQENLVNVTRTGQQIEVRAVQNVGAQNEIQRMLQKLGEENAGEADPAEADAEPAEAETKPEAKTPKKAPVPG